MSKNNIYNAIESMPVLIVCPICNDTTMVKDLKTLDDTIHKIWQLSSDWMKEFFEESVTSAAIATAGIYNKIENQVEEILDKGYLKIICKTCMTNESQRQYEKAGMSCIRIGNMIFDSNFYRKNRKMVQNEMKEKQHLFRKTFWT